MDTLLSKCTTTEVSEKEKGVGVAPCSSYQIGQQRPDLGVPVENAHTDSTPLQTEPQTYKSAQPEKVLLTIEDIVSESFSPGNDEEWFYMHAAYGQNKKAQEAFARENIFSYIPHMTTYERNSDGEDVRKRKPIFANYLFVLATRKQIKDFTNTGGTKHSLPYLHFVYNKFAKDKYGNGRCLTVTHRAMVSFLLLTQVDSAKVQPVDEKKTHFLRDQPVRITKGVFKGIVGRVARVHNQTTVVVTLEGVISMATAYIPNSFMETYTEEDK